MHPKLERGNEQRTDQKPRPEASTRRTNVWHGFILIHSVSVLSFRKHAAQAHCIVHATLRQAKAKKQGRGCVNAGFSHCVFRKPRLVFH